MAETKALLIGTAVLGAAATIAAAFIPSLLDGGGTTETTSNEVASVTKSANAAGETTTATPLVTFETKPANVYLSAISGATGTQINVSGDGFKAGEQVVLRLHTSEIGTTTANSTGEFRNVAVTVPRGFENFAPYTTSVIATGRSSAKSANAPFTVSA